MERETKCKKRQEGTRRKRWQERRRVPGDYWEGAMKRRLNGGAKELLSVLLQSFRSLTCSSDFH